MVWTPRFRGGHTRKTGGTGRTGPGVCGVHTIRTPLSGSVTSNREGQWFPASRGARIVWTPRTRGGRTRKTFRTPLSGAAASNREGEGFPASRGDRMVWTPRFRDGHSWNQTVEDEAKTESTRFGLANPQRVLLYSKSGVGGTEMMIMVMNT